MVALLKKASLVGEGRAHGHPDVLALGGVVEELLALSLRGVGPVARLPVVHPRALDVLCRRVLHELGARRRAKVPRGFNGSTTVTFSYRRGWL